MLILGWIGYMLLIALLGFIIGGTLFFGRMAIRFVGIVLITWLVMGVQRVRKWWAARTMQDT